MSSEHSLAAVKTPSAPIAHYGPSTEDIALTMGHIDANVQVLIAFGNDPGSAFNTIIRPTFSEQGLGDFCMTGLSVPGVSTHSFLMQ